MVATNSVACRFRRRERVVGWMIGAAGLSLAALFAVGCSLDDTPSCGTPLGPPCGCPTDSLSAAQLLSLPDLGFDGVQVRLLGPEDRTLDLVLDGDTWKGTMPPVTTGQYTVLVLGFSGAAVAYFGAEENVPVFGCSEWLPQNIVAQPFVTTALSVSAAGSTISAVWASVSGATFYYLERDTSIAFPTPVIDSVRGTSLDVTAAAAGWHYLRVRAGNTYVANGLASKVDSVLVSPAPSAPR